MLDSWSKHRIYECSFTTIASRTSYDIRVSQWHRKLFRDSKNHCVSGGAAEAFDIKISRLNDRIYFRGDALNCDEQFLCKILFSFFEFRFIPIASFSILNFRMCVINFDWLGHMMKKIAQFIYYVCHFYSYYCSFFIDFIL